MAVKDVKIYTGAAEGWVSIGDLSTLPISSTDGTVTLDSPSANTFTVSTGGVGRVESQPRFPLRVFNQDGSFYDATGSNSSGVFVLHNVTGTGVTRCSAFEGTLNFSGTTSELSIFNARDVNFLDGAVVTGIYSGFKSEVGYLPGKERYQFYAKGSAPSKFSGDIQTSRIVGETAPASDASIELGANLTVSTGGGEKVEIDNLGRVKLLGNAVVSDADFKTYMQFNIDSAIGGEAYKDKNLMLRAGQAFMVVNSDATVRLVNNAVLKGAADDSAEVAFPSAGSFRISTGGAERVKVEDAAATFSVQVQTPSVSGLADNDASIQLGRHFEMTTEKGGYTAFSLGGHVFQSDGSQSRFSNEGDFLVGTATPFTGDGTIDATKTVVLSEGKKGIARWSARETPTSQAVDIFLSCDYDTSEIVLNSSGQVVLENFDGSDYNPIQPNSIATRGWVESVVGSGGSVNPDTVPGTGAGARWEEQSVDVSNVEPNQQAYTTLYSYDGIFTDGLHWTSDGYQWNTSDPSQRSGTLGSYTSSDDGKVVKGNGNEYITSRYISSDMKSWRQMAGYCGKPFYLDGEFYAENGSKKFNRTITSWEAHAPFGGTLSAGTPTNVASMESGLFVLAIHTDGSVHWSTGLTGPSAWQQESRISGAKCCTFIERMGKWLVIGESGFWLSDDANLGSVNWTNAALPTAANWDRVVDDGGTISITSTAANFNLVLYCTEENGPSVEGDWQTTVNYNNRGYEGFTGTNGRTIGSFASEVEGDTRKYYYSVGGDIRVESKVDTRHVELTHPVSIASARAIEAQTQEDANAVFTEEIQRRSPVMTLTQDAYDAIPADEIDENTLYLIVG